MSQRFSLFILIFLLSAAAIFAQTLVEPVAPPAIPQTPELNPERLPLGSGDLVDISIYGMPDYHQEIRLDESGEVSLPLIGNVSISGFTREEAQNIIAERLVTGGFFRDPHVIVFVKEYGSASVSVLGEVLKPGVYPMLGRRRLYDVISLAGGLSPKAGSAVTITHRETPQEAINVELGADPAKSVSTNVEVSPGDTVVVSRAGIVYVVGDVTHPGGYVMENGGKLTVLRVIAMAQGPNKTAALNGSRIIRKGPNGLTEKPIALKKILTAKAEDVDLMPEDILFVPSSAAKNAARKSLDSILQVATGVALVSAHP